MLRKRSIEEVPYCLVKEKLKEILVSLQTEIEENKKSFEATKSSLEGKIKEKDSIIECLVNINSNLVHENEQLKKKNRKSVDHYKKMYL